MRRPDRPTYVPRALRSQNAVNAASISVTSVVETLASQAVDTAAQLVSVAANDSSSRRNTEPSSSVPDDELLTTAPGSKLQSTDSCREKTAGCLSSKQLKEIGCQDSVKKVSKSSPGSKLCLVVKLQNDDEDTSCVDSKSSQIVDAADSKSSQIVDAADSKSSQIVDSADSKSSQIVDAADSKSSHIEDLPASRGATYDVDNCQQTFISCTERLCTISQSVDTDLLTEAERDCGAGPTVISDDGNNTALLTDAEEAVKSCDVNNTALLTDAEETVTSCDSVSTVANIALDMTSLSVTDNEPVNQQQQQQHGAGKQPETVAVSNVATNESLAHSGNTTDFIVASNSITSTHSTADDVTDNDDDDGDDESWEKMFDDSGEMLRQSDDVQVNMVHR